MSAITTHILDTTTGEPGVGIPVVLERKTHGSTARLRRIRLPRGRIPAAHSTYRLVSNINAEAPPVVLILRDRTTFFRSSERTEPAA